MLRLENPVRQPAILQPQQIAQRVFTARQNNQVRTRQLLRMAHVAYTYVRLGGQRVEVGKVRDMRQLHHRHVNLVGPRVAVLALLQRDAVLIFQLNLQPRHHAQYRHVRQRFNLLNAGVQQRNIAAKLIDDHPLHPRPFVVAQQRQRAVNRRENAAAIDIRHQNHRALRHLRHAHIDDIAVAQVDFRRATRPFQHQHVILARQTAIDAEDLLAQTRFVVVIADGVHIARHFSHQHNLRFAVAGWLEQNGVHPHVRGNTCGFRLKNLRPPHLFAVQGDPGIKRHILRFERRGAQAILIKNSAQPRHQHTFADVRGGAL